MGYPTSYRRQAGKHAAPARTNPGFQRLLDRPYYPRDAWDFDRLLEGAYRPSSERVRPVDVFRRVPGEPRTFGKRNAPWMPALPQRIPMPRGLRPALGPLRLIPDALEIWPLIKGRTVKPVIDGQFELLDGPFAYPYPYNGDPYCIAWFTYAHGPITGQYVTPAPLTIPAHAQGEFGIWVKSDLNPIFNAMNSHCKVWEEQYDRTIEFVPFNVTSAVPLPAAAPQGSPMASPRAKPRVRPQEGAKAAPRPQRTPEEAGEPSAKPAPAPRGDPTTQMTVPITSTRPAGAPPRIVEKTIPRRPPGPGVTEKKLNMTPQWVEKIKKLINGFTETTDFVGALYGALPEQLQKKERAKRYGKEPSFQGKVAILLQNLDQIAPERAMYNLLENQLEDALIGRANQGLTKQAKPIYDRLRRPVGFGTGTAL